MIEIDDGTIETLTPALSSALSMSGADRKWIEALVSTITESWDNCIPLICFFVDFLADKSRPRTMSFVGSEDYIRAQFEEYILALLASVKYDNYLQEHTQQESILPDIGPPSLSMLILI